MSVIKGDICYLIKLLAKKQNKTKNYIVIIICLFYLININIFV
jgi:hypothetical protein